MSKPPKLLYFVTEDWYFCSHRMALAKAAQQQGFAITVVTRVKNYGEIIRSEGFNLIPINIARGGVNPIRELLTLYQIWKTVGQVRPDIMHNVALKPVLYGGLVGLFYHDIKSVNLIAGLGAIFSSTKLKARCFRPLIKSGLRFLLKPPSCQVIVQNSEDRELLINQLKVNESRVVLIKGSGVNTATFYPVKEPDGQVNVALVSRLLWEKGLNEFVEAVKDLKEQRGLDFSAYLVGNPDVENLGSVSQEKLQEWNQSGILSWLGYVDNVAAYWRNVHIAVLPSYREGLPKSLVEAASCGRPIVTTDTAGCNEIVKEGVNGLLVPIRNSQALADALEKLIVNADLRQKLGTEGRKRVENEFSDEIVIAETLAVYSNLMKS